MTAKSKAQERQLEYDTDDGAVYNIEHAKVYFPYYINPTIFTVW